MVRRFVKSVCIIAMLVFPIFGAGNVAVLEISGTITKDESAVLTDKVINTIISNSEYSVVERSMMKEILKEQAFQMSGCTNNECAVEIGQILGVQKMVTGNIGKIGSMYSISLRVVNVATGKIEKTSSVEVKGKIEDVLVTGIPNAVMKLIEKSDDKKGKNENAAKPKDKTKGKKIATLVTAAGAGASACASVVCFVQMGSYKDKYDALVEGSTDFDSHYDKAVLFQNVGFATGGVAIALATTSIIIGTRKVKTPKGNSVSFAPKVLPGYKSLTLTYNF